MGREISFAFVTKSSGNRHGEPTWFSAGPPTRFARNLPRPLQLPFPPSEISFLTHFPMPAELASNRDKHPVEAEVLDFPQVPPPANSPPVPNGPAEERKPASRSPSAPREFAYKLIALFLVADWLMACLAIFAGLMAREWQRSEVPGAPGTSTNLVVFVLIWSMVAALWFVWLMVLRRSYEIVNLYNIKQSLRNVLKSVFYWSLTIWACVGLFRINGFIPRVGLVYCMAILTGLFALWRLFSFFILTHPRVKNAASSRIIVVGWNEETTQLRNAMRMDPAQLGEIVGCIPKPGGVFHAPPPADLPVLGNYDALSQVIRDCGANLLVLADTSYPPEEIRRLTHLCEREMITFHIILDYFRALKSGLQVQTVSGVPLLGRSQLPIDRTMNRAVKRTMDIAGAIIGLSLSAVIVFWFCLLVYLESPGPVLYRQRRTSRSGNSFHIYKIRSMRINAESDTGAVWCKPDDSRRLRVGAFMRRWNIDELPQFYNVLVGDMSLVGPRPERPELIERFKDEIPSYNVRHEVRTGLTGWAQINGLRGDTDLRKRIEADLYYIENWSVPLDLYCLAATLFKIKNAY